MIPYLRTSTDDRSQNPARQLSAIRAWATRNDVDLLPAEIDEGTSGYKKSPFERPVFVKACERAKRAEADGLVVETDDRFSRQGTKLAGWAEVEMELVYGLKLFRADQPISDQGSLTGELVSTVKTILAREWAHQHAARVKQGIEERRMAGLPVGRKPKEISEREIRMALQWREDGVGWPTIGVRLSNERGASKVADPKVRKKRMISGRTVQRAVTKWLAENPGLDKSEAHSALEDPGQD